ncbi:MAG: flagellar basal body P-ring formation chaperone FlgA [Planctomycetota bacterium]
MNLLALVLAVVGQTSQVTVTLPTDAAVSGQSIELAEVATITAGDPAVVSALGSIDLGYAPSPGYSRTLAAQRIFDAIQTAQPGVQVRMAGSPLVRVTVRTEVVPADRLQQVAREALEALADGDRITIDLQQALVDVEVPIGNEAAVVRALPAATEVRTGTNAVTVKVEVDGRTYVTRQVLFTVQRWQNVAVLSRGVSSGEAITPDIVEVREVVLPAHQREKPLTTSMLIGSVAIRDLPAGKAVLGIDVHRPNAIQAQTPIVLEVRHGAIKARAMAVAMDSGAIGDRIRVRVVDSGREMHAHVESRDLVVIDLGGYDGFGERR